MLKTFTLKNGIKVATYSIPQMKSVYITQSVKSGAIFDEPKTSGAAHYMEHILVAGTPSYPNVEVLSEYIESLAGSYNALTSPQLIKFILNLPAKFIEDGIKIAGEVFFEPLFAEDSIEKERGAILEEIRAKLDTTWYKNSEFWRNVRYKKGHPLLLYNGGSLETISKLTKKDLVNFWSRFFHPQNGYLVIVGGFDVSKIKNQLEKYYAKYSGGMEFKGYPDLDNKDLSQRTIAIREDEKYKTCYIDLSFPSIAEKEGTLKLAPQSIIRGIMGAMRRSRLFKLLRQQRGLVYEVDFSSASFWNFGYVFIYTEVVPENAEEVITLIFKELINLYQFGPTDEEIQFAKNYLINNVLMRFDHPSNIASWIEGDLIWDEKIYSPEEYAKILGEVSKKDILDFMKKYWDFSKLNLTIQGPIKNSKANIKKFAKIVEDLR